MNWKLMNWNKWIEVNELKINEWKWMIEMNEWNEWMNMNDWNEIN